MWSGVCVTRYPPTWNFHSFPFVTVKFRFLSLFCRSQQKWKISCFLLFAAVVKISFRWVDSRRMKKKDFFGRFYLDEFYISFLELVFNVNLKSIPWRKFNEFRYFVKIVSIVDGFNSWDEWSTLVKPHCTLPACMISNVIENTFDKLLKFLSDSMKHGMYEIASQPGSQRIVHVWFIVFASFAHPRRLWKRI